VVVGGGVAGLACATRLAAGGRAVTLFERSHRVGGRVSTRVAGALSFNHGAQFASARDGGFAVLMGELRDEGVALPWPAAGKGRWTGAPFMSAIPAAMARRATAAGGSIVLRAEVTALMSVPGGWRVEVAGVGAAGVEAGGSAGTVPDARGVGEGPVAVVLAVPAPEAMRLLRAVAPEVVASLAGVTMAPCWTLMLGLEARLDAPDVLHPGAGPVSWASRDSARPGAPGTTGHCAGAAVGLDVAEGSGSGNGVERWVVQAGPAWSRAWLGRPADEVATALLAAFAELVGVLSATMYSTATLWREARTEQALGEPCLWDAARGLGLCGDWCLGARVEAAWISGDSLAGRILSGDAATC
jgi:renalase